jgi:hypothetical protein
MVEKSLVLVDLRVYATLLNLSSSLELGSFLQLDIM